jgi:quinohemoprotein amine dehydrogenase
MFLKNSVLAIAVVLVVAGLVQAQAPAAPAGIPINHQLTVDKCQGCHPRDANGMMRRISYMRTTPEVWEQAIKRMIRLNGLVIKPEEARDILRYLSNNNGLAPEEAKPAFWEAEHRLFRDQTDKVPDEALQHTCNYCHTIGRVLTQRRSRDDYEKLINMHLGLFPGAENTLRPRRAPASPFEAPAAFSAPTGGNPTYVNATAGGGNANLRSDGKDPADVAIDYLAKNQPLFTPEWNSWKAMMHTPKLEGRWMLIGYQQGKGRVFGTVTIEAGPTPDDFVTKVDLEYASTGQAISRTGKGIVYTGYSWRGRGSAPSGAPAPTDPSAAPSEWREAMMVSRDGNTMDGRWFWGGYEEFGIDAHMVRIGAVPMMAGVNVFAMQSPSAGELKVYGANLPADLKPADIDLGPGITVTRVTRNSSSLATVAVQVAPNLPVGIRDISMLRSTAERAIAVYDKIAYIKTIPDASMARLGGVVAAKQFAQFEAIAYSAGADGKPETADDIPLGPISAKWSTEEFISTPDDDDVKFVGTVNAASGLFTPNIEGPNPERKKQANNFGTDNYGDIWIDAEYTAPNGTVMKARSYLVVTIPVYVKYDQPEVSK